jgi:YqaJ-like viral recombinase domain
VALTPEQIKARTDKFTATMAKVVMVGTPEEVLSLWNQMLGMEKPTDLSGVFPVRLGEATEALNLEWYVRKIAPLTRMGEVVIGPEEWMAATLDGYDEKNKRPVECKHVGGRESLETIVSRYTPQCTWQMICTQSDTCALSVIMGTNEPVIEIVGFDAGYAKELLRRAKDFMMCIESLTPPVTLPKVEPPPPPSRVVDMTGNNAWGNYAVVWRRAKLEAEQFELAAKTLKELAPRDAQKSFGHGIMVVRNRAGAASIREMDSESTR